MSTHASANPSDLTSLRAAFPFLDELPPLLLTRLDISEFHPPDHALALTRAALEEQLGAHVMIYRFSAGAPPSGGLLHLCALVHSAALDDNGARLLLDAEREYAVLGVRFVAYERPLRLR